MRHQGAQETLHQKDQPKHAGGISLSPKHENNPLEQPETIQAEQTLEMPTMGKSTNEDLRPIECAPEGRADQQGGLTHNKYFGFKATFSQCLLVLHVITCILYGQWNTAALLYYYDISSFMSDCGSGGAATDISQCKQVRSTNPHCLSQPRQVPALSRSHTVSLHTVSLDSLSHCLARLALTLSRSISFSH